MKKSIVLLAIACVAFAACKKDETTPPPASLSFANAIAGSTALVPKFNSANYYYSSNAASTNKVSYAASTLYSFIGGNTSATFASTTDTLHTVFNGNLSLQGGGIYSLYLTGTAIAPDTVFIKENLPIYALADSTAGIRFVNLSPTNTVSVDIKGQANGSEVSNLAYKGRTAFKPYKANRAVASYIFEFRDATSGALLSTYTLSGINNSTGTNTTVNTVTRRNQTIALIGGGTVAQSAILISNY